MKIEYRCRNRMVVYCTDTFMADLSKLSRSEGATSHTRAAAEEAFETMKECRKLLMSLEAY